MRKYAIVMTLVDIVLFILFLISAFVQGGMFSQSSYGTAHLTKSSWGFFTVDVQNFDYDYLNGTIRPTSGINTYPNYPFIVSFIFMIANIMALAYIRKSPKDKS